MLTHSNFKNQTVYYTYVGCDILKSKKFMKEKFFSSIQVSRYNNIFFIVTNKV